MGVDGFESPTYMAASPTGQGVLPNPVCVSLNRIPVTRIKPGRETRRLFDIVGLDEGTCGRRPGLPEPLGSGRSVKFMPFLNGQPLELAPVGTPDVLIRKHTSLYICAGTAPRDAGLLGPIPPELVVHQLESLILAQNERWRHA